jgi:hypothetical protein
MLYWVPSRPSSVERPAMLALPMLERSMKEKSLDVRVSVDDRERLCFSLYVDYTRRQDWDCRYVKESDFKLTIFQTTKARYANRTCDSPSLPALDLQSPHPTIGSRQSPSRYARHRLCQKGTSSGLPKRCPWSKSISRSVDQRPNLLDY